MRYIHLLWLQALPDERVITVSEFDGNGFENRRVDIWRSSRIGYVGETISSDDTAIGTYHFLRMDQFDDEPCVAAEITQEEFENHWALALKAREL